MYSDTAAAPFGGSDMGYFIFETTIFVVGLMVFLFGRLPLAPRRMVRGSPAHLIGIVLMIPMAVYLIACKQTNLSPLGWTELSRTDPYQPFTGGFLRLAALASAFGCLLMAAVLALITADKRPRPDHPPGQNRSVPPPT
jgi:hypothetical protein